jgi:hypothetical protein
LYWAARRSCSMVSSLRACAGWGQPTSAWPAGSWSMPVLGVGRQPASGQRAHVEACGARSVSHTLRGPRPHTSTARSIPRSGHGSARPNPASRSGSHAPIRQSYSPRWVSRALSGQGSSVCIGVGINAVGGLGHHVVLLARTHRSVLLAWSRGTVGARLDVLLHPGLDSAHGSLAASTRPLLGSTRRRVPAVCGGGGLGPGDGVRVPVLGLGDVGRGRVRCITVLRAPWPGVDLALRLGILGVYINGLVRDHPAGWLVASSSRAW